MGIILKTDFVEIEFKNHVSIIGGLHDLGTDSGKQKTHFFSMLREANRYSPIVDGHRAVFINAVEDIEDRIVRVGDIVIVDESNSSPGLIQLLYKKVNDVNAYLILIGRIYSSVIPCNFEAIYYLNHFSEDRVEIARLADLFTDFTNVNDRSKFYCEDSEDTAVFLSQQTGLSIKASRENTKLYNCMKANFSKPVLLIADNHKYGSLFLNQVKRLKAVPSEIYLFMPACFEEIVLDYFADEETENHLQNGIAYDSVNSEQYCENKLYHRCKSFKKVQSLKSFWDCVRDKKICDLCFVDGRSRLIEELKGCFTQVNQKISKDSCVWFRIVPEELLSLLTGDSVRELQFHDTDMAEVSSSLDGINVF